MSQFSRFHHIKFDEESRKKSDEIRKAYIALENVLLTHLGESRRRSLAVTSLEESEGWANKALRDDQILRERKAHMSSQVPN